MAKKKETKKVELKEVCLHHRRRPPLHEGPRPQLRSRGRLHLRRLSRKE